MTSMARFISGISSGLLALGVAAAAGGLSADEAQPWRQRLEAKRQTPGMVQYYTFQEGRGKTTRNWLDDTPFSSMLISGYDYFVGNTLDVPRWKDGRWEGKPALSVGTARTSVGRTHFYGVPGKDFTVELSIRTVIPASGKDRAVFASVGDAYSAGWRLEADGFGSRFVLGRPTGEGEGKGVVVVGGPFLAPHVWHHLVGVLNGAKLQLYVDGVKKGETAFDGVYQHPPTPTQRHATPELDVGGLQLGDTASQRSSSRFDIDELALYKRALVGGEVAGFYSGGRPDVTDEAQPRRHQEALAREARLAGVAIDLPRKTFGYFPQDKPIPVTVAISKDAAGLFGAKAQATFAVKLFMGEKLSEENCAFEMAGAAPILTEYLIKPDRCGLYELDVTVRDEQGRVVKSAQFGFAVCAPLPDVAAVPKSSMLANYVGEDTRAFRPSVERVIQPIYGRAKDGTPNYGSSDERVDRILKDGMEVLYCIGLSFWDAGRYPTLDDWRANPKIHTDHVRNLANRYKGKVKYWEIFNEPNAHGYSAKDYAQLLKEAHAIFKEVDPEAKIVGPCGTSQYDVWIEEVLAAGGGAYLDILSFHNYIGTSPLRNMEDAARTKRVKASMLKHVGKLLPMWNSECGIHQPMRVDGRPATDAELEKFYGGRARRTDAGWVVVGVDAIGMVNEHLSACWQAQSLLVERGEGVEKYFLLMSPSQLYCGLAGLQLGESAVTEKGVALMALQSVMLTVTEARFIPMDVTGAACVALKDGKGKTTAALFADQPVTLVCKAAPAAGAAVKGMDYLGNALSFATAEGGLLRVNVTEEPIYLFDVPENFGLAADGLKITCGQTLLEPMTEVEVVAEVGNPYDRPVAATLGATVSSGSATSREKEFKLGAKETRKVPVVWQTGDIKKGAHWIRAQLLIDGNLTAVREKSGFISHGKMTRIPRFEGEFKLDGDMAKWAKVPAQTANTAAQAVIGRPVEGAPSPAFWRGPEDLSYTLQTAWTDVGLHFLLSVTDDVLRPPLNTEEDARSFLYDSLELFIDVRPLAERTAAFSPGAVQVLVAPRIGEAAAACPVRMCGREPWPVTMECVSRKHAAGYLIEGTIRPAAGGAVKLREGAQINLDVSVDDNDDQPGQGGKMGRRIQMALHGTANNNNDTSNWGRYALDAKPPAPR